MCVVRNCYKASDLRIANVYRNAGSPLLLEIPLHLTEATIVKQVKQLLRHHPNREVARKSSAKRALAKFTGIRKDLLQIAHMTWRLHTESRDPAKTYKIGEVQGSLSLYQIGKQLRLVKTCMPVPTDDAERAAKRVNGMKVWRCCACSNGRRR